VGAIRTEVAALSLEARGDSGQSSDLVVNEVNSLNLVKDRWSIGGLYTKLGDVRVTLAAAESLLTLQSGVLAAGPVGGDITLVADDIDFASGRNQVSGSGLLSIQARTSGQDYRLGGAGQSLFGRDQSVAGDTGFMAVPTSRLAVGPLVCWDQWYPEAARLTALAGAQVLFYPTAIGWLDGEEQLHRQQYEAWDTMLRSHAIANGVFVVAVNRTGREGALSFWGASVVYAPSGQRLACTSHERPETVVVECDLDQIEWSRTRWPFFRDRRIDSYAGLLKRWGK
jgi:hypothetical protein